MTEPPLPAQLRSKEDFDYFINSRGGDPWGMDGNKVEIARFEASRDFIAKYVAHSFSGTFVEGGCFNGDFTKRLLEAFPKSHIIANDISAAAIERTKTRLGDQPRVTFSVEEMGALRVGDAPAPHCLVLLESLYYMQPDERKTALEHLTNELGSPKVFISGPIHGANVYGTPYLRERDLIETMTGIGYKHAGNKALTFVTGFQPGEGWVQRLRTNWLLQNDRKFRERWAHQVIYYFQPR
jgi:hypothetical protein